MELCVVDQFVCTLGRWKQRFVFLANLLKKSSYDNLFDLHPPLGEKAKEKGKCFRLTEILEQPAG